jgi:ribosomal-protein-serine acetyltransferase
MGECGAEVCAIVRMDTPELELELGDGIHLRAPQTSDAEAVCELVSRNYSHLRTFMEWAKPDYSIDDARQWIDRDIGNAHAMNFLICRGGEILGTIGFASFDRDANVTEIGYWIDAGEQGKGIVSRAARRLVDIAFTDLGMNRVQIRCAADNLRSAAIPEKLGFKLEGVQRQHVFRDGKIYDFRIYGLLRAEWKGQNKNNNK